MGRSVVLGALLLLLANVGVSQARTVEKYFKVGGTVQLSPEPIRGAITSIAWKYNRNLLAEWMKGVIDLTYYSKFINRTALNTDTGVLEIRNLTAADTAVYSVEINNQIQSQVYQTVEIEDVPQPEVTVQPLVCSSDSETCKLVCDGDVSKAGPVEYFWKKDDGEGEKSQTNTMEIINNEETQRVKTFSCRIKNLFSEKESKALENPFYQEKTAELESPSLVGPIVGGIFGVLGVAAVGLGVWKRENLKQNIACLKPSSPPEPEPTDGMERGVLLKVKTESDKKEDSPPPNSDPKTPDGVQPNGEDAVDSS